VAGDREPWLRDDSGIMAEVAEMVPRRSLQGRDAGLPANVTGESPMLGTSAAIREAMSLAEAVAPRDTTVLLVGETGSGKGVLARYIRARSPRRRGPFVELNCAALQKELAESELFGHEKGAFTGALDRKLGLFQTAEGGTLFLDEIGEMEAGVQAKLLRVLESRTFRRVGGVAEIPCNVRLVAATHRNLPERVAQNQFREDLFHRLNVFTIAIPPLRARLDDIPLLAESFLHEYAGADAPVLGESARDYLLQQAWPGNVRELRNAIERAIILCPPRGVLMPSHFPAPATCRPRPEPAGAMSALRTADCEHIEAAVRSCRGNIGAAARLLGVARSTIYRKARRYGIPI
jgi:two-component system, NtrC family, response regulator